MATGKGKKSIVRPKNKSKVHFNSSFNGSSKKRIVKPKNKSKATPNKKLTSKDQLLIDIGANFNEFCNYVEYLPGQPRVKRIPNLENTETKQSRINLIERAFEDILTFYLNKKYNQPREVTKNLFKKYAFGSIGPLIPSDLGRLNADKQATAKLFFDFADIKLNADSKQAQKNMWEFISSSGSSSGWDKDHDTIEKLANSNDIFNEIEGRTRTRYGYETNTFLQGPHTIARIFGYKLRKELFLRGRVKTIGNVDSLFAHLGLA